MEKEKKELYKNKYRIKSARLQDWNYTSKGFYYVTICVKNHECVFGNIIEGRMFLSEIGKIAYKCWREIPEHFPFVKLDEFILMPNHIHGIIEIVETQNLASLRIKNHDITGKWGPQSMNLASIIRGFKIGVKKWATLNNINFAWQSRFYDHIIRDDKDLLRIQKYIINNPLNWNEDDYFVKQ